MVFKSISSKDLAEVRNLQPEDWTDIIPYFEFYIRSSYCKTLKIREKSKIAGIGALILFDYNSAAIKEESKPLLRMYGKVLQDELADTVLIVAGHTDSKGSDQYNLGLSRRRAEAVRQFFVSEYQIAENRLLIKPYGEKKPIESNATDEGRAKNRRVEFIRIQ